MNDTNFHDESRRQGKTKSDKPKPGAHKTPTEDTRTKEALEDAEAAKKIAKKDAWRGSRYRGEMWMVSIAAFISIVLVILGNFLLNSLADNAVENATNPTADALQLDAQSYLATARRQLADLKGDEALDGSISRVRLETQIQVYESIVQSTTEDIINTAKNRKELKLVQDRWSTIQLSVGLASSIVILLALCILVYYQMSRRQKFRTWYAIDQVERLVPPDPMDLVQVATYNRDRLNSYHKLVVEYAAATRRVTTTTIVVGFLATAAIALWGLTRIDNWEDSATTAILTAVAGTLTAFITNATLVNSKESANELQRFFNNPVNIEKAVTAQRIAQSIPAGEHQNEALLKVVEFVASQDISTQTGGDR